MLEGILLNLSKCFSRSRPIGELRSSPNCINNNSLTSQNNCSTDSWFFEPNNNEILIEHFFKILKSKNDVWAFSSFVTRIG